MAYCHIDLNLNLKFVIIISEYNVMYVYNNHLNTPRAGLDSVGAKYGVGRATGTAWVA